MGSNTVADSAKGEVRRFGPFEVNLRSGELRKSGRLVKLQEQPFQVLAALVERPGEIVTREELREKVWPANTYVDFYNSLNIAVGKLRQALKDDAAKPRYIETLPRRGYRFIAAVEEVAPGPTPADALAAAPEIPTYQEHSRMQQVLAACAVSAATLAVCWLIWAQVGRRTANAAGTPRPSAAVLGFRNLAARPDQNWLSGALADMIATELAAGERVRTIPGERVARTRIDLALPDADSFSPGTLTRIRKNLGADYVVVGSYLDTGGQSGGRLRLDLRLQDTRAGQTVATFSEMGGLDNLPDLVSRTGMKLSAKLSVGFLSQAQSQSARAALPSGPDDARLFAEGLAKLRHFDARGARDLLEQAVATNPDYAPAHAALAAAWSQLGYLELAKQEAKKAWDFSGKLPRADRMFIEASYRETTGEWDKAVATYLQLHDLFPDNIDYGLRLVAAEVKAGNAKDALAKLEKLRKLPIGNDPAVDLALSLAAAQLGDLQQAEAADAKAAGQADALGAQMLLAEARAQQCGQLRLLGRLDNARNACQSAREIYARAGDRSGVARTLGSLGAVLADQGDLAAAHESYSQALTIDREIGNEGGALWELNGLADVEWVQGDLPAAQRFYQEAMDTAHRTGSRHDEANALDNVALASMLEGDLARARASFGIALEQFRGMSDKGGAANVLDNLGATLYYQGDLAGAANALDQAAALDKEAGNKAELADVESWAGRVRLAQGDLDAAHQKYDEALRLSKELGSQGYVAQYRLRLADLAIEGQRPNEAEAPIREGLPIFQHDKQRDVEVEARTLLARALLEQGKTAEARQEINVASGLMKESQQAATRLELSTVAARVRAATGSAADLGAAIRSLESIAADAGRRGFVGCQLQARLALGQAELRAGKDKAGQALLQTVEKDAQSHGFGTIARQAAAAREARGGKG